MVASSGTSLTVDQIRLIKRWTNNLTIMYDGDDAGIKASFRGIDLVLQEGMNVRTVLFPQGDDPDSYSRKLDQVDFQTFIENNAKDFIQFKSRLLLNDARTDPVKIANAQREVIDTISSIENDVVRNQYVSIIYQSLNIDQSALENEVKRQRAKYKREKRRTPNVQNVPNNTQEQGVPESPQVASYQGVRKRDTEFQERDIIRILMLYANKDINLEIWDDTGEKVIDHEDVNVSDYICTEITEDEIVFEFPLYQRIFDEYNAMLQQEKIPTEQHFIQNPDADISSLAVTFYSTPYAISERWGEHNIVVQKEEDTVKRAIMSSLNVLKLRKLEKMINRTRVDMKAAKEEQLFPLMEKLNRQLSVRKQLAKVIGSTVLK